MNNYIFFYGGPLSNWHPCKFIVEDVHYNCVEQYMMATKALMFKDNKTYELIMKEISPREQKNLGRKVKNFNNKDWDLLKFFIVLNGCLAKFMQNAELGLILKNTGTSTLVEASPYDRVWGIGFSEKDAHKNYENWGENLLGQVLMKVRSHLNLKNFS